MKSIAMKAVTTACLTYVRNVPLVAGKSFVVSKVLLPLLAANPRAERVKTTFGASFYADSRDEIQRHLLMFRSWEPNLTHFLQQRLGPGDVFVDVGANIGYFTALASPLVGDQGAVVAIEPSPRTFPILEEALRRNGLHNVRSENVAIAAQSGTLRMYVESAANVGNTSSMQPSTYDDAFDVRTETLVSAIGSDELARARVIKIDVEGMEAELIQALTPVLPTLRQDAEIVIELAPMRLAEQGIRTEDAIAPLLEAGFNVYRMSNDTRTWQYPSVLSGGFTAPYRWREPFEGMSDFVFSRIDAEVL